MLFDILGKDLIQKSRLGASDARLWCKVYCSTFLQFKNMTQKSKWSKFWIPRTDPTLLGESQASCHNYHDNKLFKVDLLMTLKMRRQHCLCVILNSEEPFCRWTRYIILFVMLSLHYADLTWWEKLYLCTYRLCIHTWTVGHYLHDSAAQVHF